MDGAMPGTKRKGPSQDQPKAKQSRKEKVQAAGFSFTPQQYEPAKRPDPLATAQAKKIARKVWKE